MTIRGLRTTNGIGKGVTPGTLILRHKTGLNLKRFVIN